MSLPDLTGLALSTLRVPASIDAPAIARSSVVERVRPVLGVEGVDDARLMVSEVVTNAVRHAGLTTADEIELEVRFEPDGVLVVVTDHGCGFDRMPARPSIGGWGLPLLQRLSDGWGVLPGDDGGSIVWFRIARGA